MSAREIVEWYAYYQLNPFGPERDNYHAAMIAHIMANQNRRKNAAEIPLSRFMYEDQDTAQRKRDERMLNFFKSRVKADG